MRLSNEEAETMFARIRWPETKGAPVCPNCAGQAVYDLRRPNGPPRWRCKACNKEFTVTSGTLFAWHKLPVQSYLSAIAIFANEVKGKAALALSRDLGTSYKTAFVLAHKISEATASEMKGERVGGEGKTVESDGACFGGYVKPANLRENRRDRRLARTSLASAASWWWSGSAAGQQRGSGSDGRVAGAGVAPVAGFLRVLAEAQDGAVAPPEP
jgi:transposase-like protein